MAAMAQSSRTTRTRPISLLTCLDGLVGTMSEWSGPPVPLCRTIRPTTTRGGVAPIVSTSVQTTITSSAR